jgi:hypothetical protein
MDKIARRREYSRAFRLRNPKIGTSYSRKRKFGVTQDRYDAMLSTQGGVCAICGHPETSTWRGVIKALAVDHCHVTMRVRSLLCMRCNSVIGMCNESVPLLNKMANYLSTNNNT